LNPVNARRGRSMLRDEISDPAEESHSLKRC
jgi:hypothetical protein